LSLWWLFALVLRVPLVLVPLMVRGLARGVTPVR
jgi:hypothetical protein